MSVTDAEYAQWLLDPSAICCVLVEVMVRVNGVETLRRLSNRNYVSDPTANPPNEYYLPILSNEGVTFAERLSLDDDPSLSYGHVELANVGGVRDGWLQDVFENRSIKAYFGDIRWSPDKFRLVLDGTVAKIIPKGNGKLALLLRDKLQRLNTPLSDQKLGGATANANEYLRHAFGELFNVTPVLKDPATQEWQLHGAAMERLIETRANGVVVSTTDNLAGGTFRLNVGQYGTITCSVQGDKTAADGYKNTIATLVRRIATGYGSATERFTAADIDQANLDAFDAAHPQPVGIYANGSDNQLAICRALARSLGAQVLMTATGQLQLYQIALPPGGTPATIYPADIVDGSLELVDVTDVVPSVELRYCKNWTVQSEVSQGVPTEHADFYRKEWVTSIRTNAAQATERRLISKPLVIETMLQVTADADAEAQRQATLRGTPRRIFRMTGLRQLLALKLGQAVTLYSERHGLAAGATGIVCSRTPTYGAGRVTLEVLI